MSMGSAMRERGAAAGTAMASGTHSLDRPIWNALVTCQAHLAQGDARARRYPAEIGPFAGMPDASGASFAALRGLMPPADGVALFTVEKLAPPAGLEVVRATTFDQMTATAAVIDPPPHAPPFALLGAADVPEMLDLVAVTHPGPFAARTHELGRYLGVRAHGRLVAMAGERMRLDGFTEISAVCTHPGHRGHGYAFALVAALCHGVLSRRDVAFLHVFSDNHPALALYRRLGFTFRRTMHLTVLRRDATESAA